MRHPMPDEAKAVETIHLSFRAPADLVEQFDRVAGILVRPRTWVLVRALRRYMGEGERADLLTEEVEEAAIERGEGMPFEDAIKAVDRVIAKGAKPTRK